MELKTCKNCKKELPIEDFYKRKASKSGYDCNCKQCRNDINRRSKEKNNKPKTPEQKAKAVQAVREWRQRNPEKAREMARRTAANRTEEQKEANRERTRQWKKKNKEWVYL